MKKKIKSLFISEKDGKINPVGIFVVGWILSVIVGLSLGKENGMIPSLIIGISTTLASVVGYIIKIIDQNDEE